MSELENPLTKAEKAKLEMLKLQPNAGDLLYFRIAKKKSHDVTPKKLNSKATASACS